MEAPEGTFELLQPFAADQMRIVRDGEGERSDPQS